MLQNANSRRGAAAVPRLMLVASAVASAMATALARPAHAQPAQTGTIEGVVTTTERAPRRTLNRYAGSGNAAARTLQEVPNIAYLTGPIVSGHSAGAPAQAQIAQQDTAFEPGALIVPVNTTVAFPNRDDFYHNVFSFSPAQRFDLGRYPRGESKSVTFDQAGVVKVYCEVHQFMRAAVIVVENPYHAEVGADGTFTIENVPAGTHRLVVWDIERRPQEVAVTVTPGVVARVRVTLR